MSRGAQGRRRGRRYAVARVAGAQLPWPVLERHTLSNGVRCIAARTPGLRTAHVRAIVGVGSRDETPETNGISHLLEHVCFRGTASYRSQFELSSAVDDFGGSLNGETSREETAFFTNIVPSEVERAVTVLGEMVTSPRLTDIEKEIAIVGEEIREELDARGRHVDLDELALAQLFPGHGLGLPVAGTLRSVARFTHAQLGAHHRMHYVAGNIVVVAAGDFPPSALFRVAEGSFANVPSRVPQRRTVPCPSPVPARRVHCRASSARVQLQVSYPGPAPVAPEYQALELAAYVLDGGLSSRLPRRIVEELALAYDVGASVMQLCDSSRFTISATCSPRNARKVLAQLRAAVQEICEKPVPDAEFEAAKRRRVYAVGALADSPEDLCDWIASLELRGNFVSLESEIAAATHVTPRALRETAATYLAADRSYVTEIRPTR